MLTAVLEKMQVLFISGTTFDHEIICALKFHMERLEKGQIERKNESSTVCNHRTIICLQLLQLTNYVKKQGVPTSSGDKINYCVQSHCFLLTLV